MANSLYPEPDGFVKMRFRDVIFGAIVVACFALAAFVLHIWRTLLRETIPKLRTKLMRLARQNR